MLDISRNQPPAALGSGIGDPSQSASAQSIQFLEELIQLIQKMLQQMQNPGDGGTPSVGGPSASSAPAAQPAAAAAAPAASATAPAAAPAAPSAPPVAAASATPAAPAAAASTTPATPVTPAAAASTTPATPAPAQSAAVGAAPASGGDMTPAQVASTYKTQIMSASQATGVPPGIIAGQIWQESKGIASTPGGGLMQLGPNEFQQFGGGDMSNPTDNINAGANYMKSLASQFGGNMGAALRAYNSGPNGVDLNNLNSTPAGTGDPTYVQKVMQAAQQSGLATS